MMFLAPNFQVFRPIKSIDANVYMLHVECTHLQDLRLLLRETVEEWVFGYTVRNQDEVLEKNVTPHSRAALSGLYSNMKSPVAMLSDARKRQPELAV
jgi:hypothetical protein